MIGNPPYGAVVTTNADSYFRKNYTLANYQLDTYVLFVEKANKLVKKEGHIGFITPSAWVASVYDIKLRKFLTNDVFLYRIIVCPKKTFKDATVETCILLFQRGNPRTNFYVERWDLETKNTYLISLDTIISTENLNFQVYTNPLGMNLINKMRRFTKKLDDYTDVIWGVKVYEVGKGTPPQTKSDCEKKVFHSNFKKKSTFKPLVGGSEILRYKLDWKGGYINYGKWLAAPRTPDWFEGERILVREVTAKGKIQATLVATDIVFSNSVDGIRVKEDSVDLRVILGILNSPLASFYHSNTSPNAFKGTFPKLLLQDLRGFPLPDLKVSSKNKVIEDLGAAVERILEIHESEKRTSLESDKEHLQAKFLHYDLKINSLVYQLYELTPDEIKIVEQS